MFPFRPCTAAICFLISTVLPPLFCLGTRSWSSKIYVGLAFQFAEAPEYRNSGECASPASSGSSYDRSLVHVAMTLDMGYLCGSIAAVHSVLRHASCPESVFFHFIAGEFDPANPWVLARTVRSTFHSLNFKVHIFREDTVLNLISSYI